MKSLIAVILSGVLALAGCNTIKGAGQDIEAGGEKVQEAAQDAKEKM